MNELLERIEEGDAASVKALLEAGADPNTYVKTGITVLMAAVRCGNAEIPKLLLEAGADPNIQNILGYTALMAADNADVARLLLEAQRADRATAMEAC